jgi:hypothetical protein
MSQVYLKRIRDWALAKVKDGQAQRGSVDPYVKLVQSVDDILARRAVPKPPPGPRVDGRYQLPHLRLVGSR